MGRRSGGGGCWRGLPPVQYICGGHPCYWPQLLENAKSASSLATDLGYDWKLLKLLHQMSDFKAKMHQIVCRLALCRRPRIYTTKSFLGPCVNCHSNCPQQNVTEETIMWRSMSVWILSTALQIYDKSHLRKMASRLCPGPQCHILMNWAKHSTRLSWRPCGELFLNTSRHTATA